MFLIRAYVIIQLRMRTWMIRNPLNGDPGLWSDCRQQQLMMFNHDNHLISWTMLMMWLNLATRNGFILANDMTADAFVLAGRWNHCHNGEDPSAAHRDQPTSRSGTSPKSPTFLTWEVRFSWSLSCMFIDFIDFIDFIVMLTVNSWLWFSGRFPQWNMSTNNCTPCDARLRETNADPLQLGS